MASISKQTDPQSPSTTDEKDIKSELSDDEALPARFSPNEEADLLAESNAHKTVANTLFASKSYDAAITEYSEAAAVCPSYLDYELAVLKSNIAACHLKLEEWKLAIDAATASLSRLDKADKELLVSGDSEAAEKQKTAEAEDGVEEEIISIGAAKSERVPGPAEASRHKKKEDALRIRAKALMRRARARSELGGWSNLAGAEEDYKLLSEPPLAAILGAADRQVVRAQLRSLPPRTKAAQEKEMAEMWGKLKELGNGILKPFGLSTDNFQMVKDEKTGGYSMNFRSNDER